MKIPTDPVFIPYNVSVYDFVTPVANLLGVADLGTLHEQHEELFRVGADSVTSFHKRFYDKLHAGWPEMETLYKRFVEELIMLKFNCDTCLYQKFPTFRVHLRGNLAVGAFHTDAEFGHPKGEINFILPLTDAEGTATAWVETEIGSNRFQPVLMYVGSLIQFNGNELMHGNHVNDTERTRVSLDFRILPAEFEKNLEQAAESVTLKTKFVEGAYYKRFKKSDAEWLGENWAS